jgi:drug/metabolite transporter (DMT)-like permease
MSWFIFVYQRPREFVMTSLAIVLVLSSAFTHALWNYLSKRAIGGIAFIWLFGIIEVVLFFPIFLITMYRENVVIGGIEILMLFGSAMLHLIYFTSLLRGYKFGDLSIVYPFSRGIGPVLSTIAAVILLNERPSMLAVMGTILIGIGIIGLTGDPRKFRKENLLTGLFYAGITGVTIAAYTIWDSYTVKTVELSPFVFQWGVTTLRMIVITPIMFRQWGQVKLVWEHDKWKAVGVGVLSSLSYILMLFALADSDVSYVAPLRSISILMGIVMGAYLLKEGNLQKRFGAASIMVLGAIALGLG